MTNSFGQVFNVDVGDSSVRFSATVPSSAIGTVTLGDLVWANDPLAVIIGIDNLLLGVSPAGDLPAVTTTADSVAIDFGGNGTLFDVASFVSFDIVTDHGATTVPEPGTVALVALSFAGLAVGRRENLV